MAIKSADVTRLANTLKDAWEGAWERERVERLQFQNALAAKFETTPEFADLASAITVITGQPYTVGELFTSGLGDDIDLYRKTGVGGHLLRWLDAEGYQNPHIATRDLDKEPEYAAFLLCLNNSSLTWANIQGQVVALISDLVDDTLKPDEVLNFMRLFITAIPK